MGAADGQSNSSGDRVATPRMAARLRGRRVPITSPGLEALASRWRELEQHAHANPFLTFEWMDAWWRAFGEGHEPYVISVEDDEATTIGIAALMRSVKRGRFGGRIATLRLMGDPGSDRLGFVSRRGLEREVADAVSACLRRNQGDWHVLAFSNLVSGSPELEALVEGFTGDHLVIGEPGLACPYLTIRGDWASYLKGRSANFRSEVRRARRKVEQELGGQIRTCHEPGEALHALEFLFQHSIERFAEGSASSFSDRRLRAFHLTVAPRLLELGRLSLFVLEIEGEIAAVLYDFAHGDTVWFYNAAFDPRWGPFKVGSVLLAHAIEDAFSQGAQEFDFLLGAYPYKLRWTSEARQHRLLTVVRPHPNAVLEAAVPRWWDGTKEWVKRTAPPKLATWLRQAARVLGDAGAGRGRSRSS